jgi:peptide/nickel transport system permease protein
VILNVVLKRILITIPTLWAVATLTFIVVNVLPGDVAQNILGDQATAAQLASLRHQLGLDRPFLAQYFDWLGGALHGDLGTSLTSGTPVAQEVVQRLPVTLSLAVCATVFAAVVGTGIGTMAAVRGGKVDQLVRAVTSIGMAVPGFWAAELLVVAFAVHLRVFPATGYTGITDSPPQWALGLVLPVVAVALASLANIARQARASLLQAFGMDYIRTLQSAGIPRSSIVMKHALRNASIPVVTTLGLEFVGLLSGTIIVEQVFTLPGISQLALGAVTQLDTPVIMGIVLFATLIVLVLNLVVDICYVLLNPRGRKV